MFPAVPAVPRRALLTGAAAVSLGGCLPRAHGDATPDRLRLMGNPYTALTYERLASAWAAAGGRRPELAFTPRDAGETIRQLLLLAFTGRPLPHVAFLDAGLVRTFAERGLLAPLDGLLPPPAGADRLRRFGIAGEIMGLPFGLSVPVVAVNIDLARGAGADTDRLPTDWARVLALAQAIRDSAPGGIGGFIEHDNGGAFTFLSLIQSFGLQAMNAEETRLGFAGPEGVAPLAVLRGFGAAGQARADMSRRQARRAFAEGRVGVLITMSSVIPHLQATTGSRFTLAVRPLPAGSPDATTPTAGPVGVVFAAEPARRREAAQLLSLASGPRGQRILAETSGYAPANGDVRIRTSGLRLEDLADPARVTGWYSFPGRNALKLTDLIQSEMQQVATLQASPEAAHEAIVRAARQLLQLP